MNILIYKRYIKFGFIFSMILVFTIYTCSGVPSLRKLFLIFFKYGYAWITKSNTTIGNSDAQGFFLEYRVEYAYIMCKLVLHAHAHARISEALEAFPCNLDSGWYHGIPVPW